MYRIRDKIRILYIFVDIVLIAFSFIIPYLLRFDKLSFRDFLTLPFIWGNLNLPDLSTYLMTFLLWGIISMLLLNNYGLYRTAREVSIPAETWLVFKALFTALVPAAATIFFLKFKFYSRLVFGCGWVLMFLSLSLWRMTKRCIVRRLISHGYNNLNVLIVGAGKVGKALARGIDQYPYLGLKIIGYLDDSEDKKNMEDKYEALGKISDFETVVRRKFIDEVFISIPSERGLVSDLVMKCKELGVSVRVVPDLFDLAMSKIKIHYAGSIPLLEYHYKGIHGTDLSLKRMMDIVISFLAIILLSPIFLLLGIAIKLRSRGPIIYNCKRCGKKGRVFNFYKFRSMVRGADKMLDSLRDRNETGGPIFKIRKDPRVTKVGRFMRRYSLDEFPQLLNVLNGDMSLVGPRPPIPDEVERYRDREMKRLEIRPGITGLWQVSGRSDLSYEDMIRLDFQYIQNWSIWLDLKILLKTVPAILSRKGAY
jgi:exopolysaccharide biosynthesis polyprenyl glycosylphosphotransferase